MILMRHRLAWLNRRSFTDHSERRVHGADLFTLQEFRVADWH